jgi:hypothetical protein
MTAEKPARRSVASKCVLLLLLVCASSLQHEDALPKRKPPMGWNSWNCYHSAVTADDLKSTADFFESSGLAAAGYTYVNTDGMQFVIREVGVLY